MNEASSSDGEEWPGEEAPRYGWLPWAFTLVLVVVLCLATYQGLKSIDTGPRPAFLSNESASSFSPPSREAAKGSFPVLQIAGSGSSLDLVRALGEEYNRLGRQKIRIHDSIGSSGAFLAVEDGAIALGLSSRAPNPEEKSSDLVMLPYAQTGVVLAGHADLPVDELPAQDLLRIYSGEQEYWPDGQKIRVFQREAGDSGTKAISSVIPGFEKVNQEAWEAERWPIIYLDSAMHERIRSTPGSLGLLDYHVIAKDAHQKGGMIIQGEGERHLTPDEKSLEYSDLKVLSLSGRPISASALDSPESPFKKRMSFIYRSSNYNEVKGFLDFVYSKRGNAIIRSFGYQPVGKVP